MTHGPVSPLRVGTWIGLGALIAVAGIVVGQRMAERRAAIRSEGPVAPDAGPGAGAPGREEATPDPRSPAADAPVQLPLEEVVRRTLPSVVRIKAALRDGTEEGGSGFVVASEGIVVTNRHVVEEAAFIQVVLPGGRSVEPRRVLAAEHGVDLVALVLATDSLPALAMSVDPPERGASVVAVGHPFGLEGSVTEGIVSALRRTDAGTHLIQTSAAISSGNSGGPLVDRSGRVVGVVTFKVLAEGAESLNFAVSSEAVAALLERRDEAVEVAEWYAGRGRDGRSDDPEPAGPAALAGLWDVEGGWSQTAVLDPRGDDVLRVRLVQGHRTRSGVEYVETDAFNAILQDDGSWAATWNLRRGCGDRGGACTVRRTISFRPDAPGRMAGTFAAAAILEEGRCASCTDVPESAITLRRVAPAPALVRPGDLPR